MNLRVFKPRSDYGSSTGRTTQTGQAQASSRTSGTIPLNRQIRSLTPGQTLQGEVVSRNGNEVQIRLADDSIMNAKLDQNMNIEVGKNMTFEVKNNGSALTLSPLFANVATDVNVLKALDMAGISVNPTSVAMAEQMMEAGLPIDKNSIQQLYREVNAFPNAEISDIINLHKLGLPVNEENVNQMIAYRNLNYQLEMGMETIMDAIPGVIEELIANGDLESAAKLYEELLKMAQESSLTEGLVGEEGALQEALEDVILDEAVLSEEAEVQDTILGLGAAAGGTQQVSDSASEMQSVSDGRGLVLAEEGLQQEGTAREQQVSQEQQLSQELRSAVSEELRQVLSDLKLSHQESAELAEQIQQFSRGDVGVERLLSTVEQLLKQAGGEETGGRDVMQLLLSQKGIRTLLTNTLQNSWMLKPEDVANPDKVESLYKRLDSQFKSLRQVLQDVGQSGSEAYRATTNMSQNVDFLHQINQMYTYLQLPLHLQQGKAHGDLYVYTNKRGLAGRDGKVSALLHLDMEHLGPVDVYVAMQNNNVSTRFYVANDEMLDFLEAHMDLLTERLQKRGYDCSVSMETRGTQEGDSSNSGLEPILMQEKGIVLSQYAFDVRT